MTMEFPEYNDILEVYPHFYFGVDKLGRPIYIERLSNSDFGKLMKVIPEKRYIKYFTKSMEIQMNKIFPACSHHKGELV